MRIELSHANPDFLPFLPSFYITLLSRALFSFCPSSTLFLFVPFNIHPTICETNGLSSPLAFASRVLLVVRWKYYPIKLAYPYIPRLLLRMYISTWVYLPTHIRTSNTYTEAYFYTSSDRTTTLSYYKRDAICVYRVYLYDAVSQYHTLNV